MDVRLDKVGLGWVGLGWVGLGWVGLGKVSFRVNQGRSQHIYLQNQNNRK
jgi:hypothetical protein